MTKLADTIEHEGCTFVFESFETDGRFGYAVWSWQWGWPDNEPTREQLAEVGERIASHWREKGLDVVPLVGLQVPFRINGRVYRYEGLTLDAAMRSGVVRYALREYSPEQPLMDRDLLQADTDYIRQAFAGTGIRVDTAVRLPVARAGGGEGGR